MWQNAAENLKKAQVVYENLLNALPEEEQSLYKAKVNYLLFLNIKKILKIKKNNH